MAWQNAPVLNKLAATQLIGKNGGQIWGVDHRGRLYTNYQVTPGGNWDGWMTNSWCTVDYPEPVYELCAAQQHEAEAQLWVLDMKRELWTVKQGKDGNWSKWEKDWNKPPGTFHFKKMAALWQGIKYGSRFWGITENGILTSSAQSVPAGNWGSWEDWPKTPQDLNKNPPVYPAEWVEVTACTQGDGKGALWALDTKRQLWGMGQESPGGKWGAWSGPNWQNAPKLINIAAVEMTVTKGGYTYFGACIWGITDEYKLVYNQQSAPGTNDWWGWTQGSFKDELRGYEITAARQNNGQARVWVISNNQVLVSQQVDVNSSPPGWERYWTPELS